MAGISSIGLGSGLDLTALVDQLVAAETQPVANRLNVKESDLQAKLSAFGNLKSTLSTVQDSLTSLSEIGAGRTATSSRAEVLSASANESAAVGNYSIQVSQLANAQSLASPAYSSSSEVVGTGTLTISLGTTDYDPETDAYNGFVPNPEKSPQVLTIDSENQTLEGIRDAINEADFGVNAAIVNDGTGYRLLLSSEETGVANSLQITVTDDNGSGLADLAFDGVATNLEQTVAAQDAQLVINGLAISSPSNSVSEAIEGVSLELKDVSNGDAVTLNVGLDKSAVSNALDGFIGAYNDLVDLIQSLTNYDPETRQASVLSGDSSVRTIASQLRNGLLNQIEGASDVYRYLVDVGVSTESNGKLSLDDTKFDTAVTEDFAGIVDLVNGFSEQMEQTVSGYLNTGGFLEARTQGIQARIDDIDDRRVALDRRFEALQARYVKQFTALDTLLGQLQNTSNFLTQQLSSLNNISGSNSNS
jgi:flagellar hook-associated protein 2